MCDLKPFSKIQSHILINYRDIKPTRENVSLPYNNSDVRPSSRNTFIPCIVLAKDGNSQEIFPVLLKEEARNLDLFFNQCVNNLVSKGSYQKPMLS